MTAAGHDRHSTLVVSSSGPGRTGGGASCTDLRTRCETRILPLRVTGFSGRVAISGRVSGVIIDAVGSGRVRLIDKVRQHAQVARQIDREFVAASELPG